MQTPQYVLVSAALLTTAGICNPQPAFAQRIGQASLVKNEVVRGGSNSSQRIAVGDPVARDETIRTGSDSAARFTMIDNTNLSLGPGSSIKLDRAVFSGETKFQDIAIRASGGAFRFVTGSSDKSAYTITTPLATLGIRGTVIDVLSQTSRTVVVLQEGASSVCTRPKTRDVSVQCVQLLVPGDSAVVTAAGNQLAIQKTTNPPWTFASTCQAAAGLCGTTQFANMTPVGGALGGLCGR